MKHLFLFLFCVFSSEFFAQPGTLDPTFGNGDGIVITTVGMKDDWAESILVQPDGKIVVAGYTFSPGLHFALARYQPNGILDNSFGGGDGITLTLGGPAYAATLQPDGKILMAGYMSVSGKWHFAARRYLPDGILDNAFGSGGSSAIDLGHEEQQAFAVALQPDGKIVLVGKVQIGSESSFGVVRLLYDGSLDTTFSSDGTTTILDAGYAQAVEIQPDGKILIAGYASFQGSDIHISLARLNPSGTLDSSFGMGGTVLTTFSNVSDLALSMSLQPDGKIIVGGESYDNQVVTSMARYNTDGSIDSTFGTNGITTVAPGRLSGITRQPDGKLLGAGFSGQDFVLVRLNANGTPDSTFGNSGTVIQSVGNYYDYGADVAVQPDGKILVVGTACDSPNYSECQWTILRYISGLSVGTIDAASAIESPLVFPNPLRGRQISLEYELPAASSVRIELLDGQGQILATLLSAERFSGKNKETLMLPGGLASGFYLLNIRTERGNAVVKIEALTPR